MYLYLTDLCDQNQKEKLIGKIGYTGYINTREFGLEYKLSCNVYLLGYKIVNGRWEEEIFHTKMNEKFPELIVTHYNKYNIKIKELYYIEPKLMNQFHVYDVPLPINLEQERTKQKSLDKIIEEEKTKQIENQFREQTKQEEEKTKQKELDLKKIIHEIELVKLQIELAKINQSK
jgi:hypothetical protein